MATGRSTVVRPVLEDLQRIFADRLHAVVMYGWRTHGPVPTLALVSSLGMDDLHACAARANAWRRAGAATPLLLTRTDFERSLDAFPIEYGEIIYQHEVLFGTDPFVGLTVNRDDLRRACELQVKSHLIHIREDYLESGGHHGEIESLVRESAPGFIALLRHLARLEEMPVDGPADLMNFAQHRARLDGRLVGDLIALGDSEGMSPVDAVKIFPAYLTAMEQLAEFVDRWRQS